MTELTVLDPPAAPRPARPALTALIVLTGVFLSSLDLFIVNIAFPSISATYHGESLSSLSWVLSAYTIVFAAVLVPAGRWADRAGRKKAFLLGLAIFTASSALCAVAPSLDLLVAARVLQASGGALMLPTSLGLLLPAFGPERKGAAIGLWSAVGGAAAALGPPIGGLLVQASWRWVFLVNLPFSVVALFFGVRLFARGARPCGAQGRPARCGTAHGGGGQPGGRARRGPRLGLVQSARPRCLRAGGAERDRARRCVRSATRTRFWSRPSSATAPWHWPTSAPSPSSAASARSCSAASSS